MQLAYQALLYGVHILVLVHHQVCYLRNDLFGRRVAPLQRLHDKADHQREVDEAVSLQPVTYVEQHGTERRVTPRDLAEIQHLLVGDGPRSGDLVDELEVARTPTRVAQRLERELGVPGDQVQLQS